MVSFALCSICLSEKNPPLFLIKGTAANTPPRVAAPFVSASLPNFKPAMLRFLIIATLSSFLD
jgi:hypothetical protein